MALLYNLIDKGKNYTDIFVFGCGNIGNAIYHSLKEKKLAATLRRCDNNVNLPCVDGEILKPEEAFFKYPNALFVVGSEVYYQQMLLQLKAMGVADENIFAKQTAINERMIAKPFLLKVDYNLVEHCNLNCESCNHFSSLAKEHFADINEFRTTFARFVEVMGDKLQGILLLGGEPLLHPLVEQFIISARKFLAHGFINVYTNGLLLRKMPESFWNTCAEYKADITISVYPINIDISLIRALADKHKIHLDMPGRSDGAWVGDVIDLEGRQDITSSFVRCGQANSCSQLKNGRLYPCSILGGAKHFNQAFNQNLEIMDEDSLDIFSDISSRDVLEFLASPVPFCRYCNKDKTKLGQRWAVSKRVIGEWLE